MALITPAPRLDKRAGDLLGWYSGATGWEKLTCNSVEIYTTSGKYAGCYGTAYLSSMGLRVNCQNAFNASSTDLDVTLTCTDTSWPCVTQTIIQTQPNIGTLYNYACGAEGGFAAFTIYRTTQASATSASSTSASPKNSASGATALSTAGTTGPGPTNTKASSSGGGTNTGAIVGGVVGGVAFAVFAAILGWWLLSRRRRNQQNAPLLAAPPPGDAGGYYGMVGQPQQKYPPDVPGYPIHQWGRTELPGMESQVVVGEMMSAT
ncbi:uncharacterized protein BDR25DRAFT_317922 [Lindgomyces ingoldianus]|uniref:Uncharacterized protein n=1 Tax=Lindgomyces ingoldianus TaxID=673940 RepID=A0ACB6QJ22_9PLEO|nr:uncharacterized protein BDR25DRAFT_317922 [Lindgomyces ingoldianus]KAF2466117.1 hypothetical protein BDR25DRAFT_317922 [Lindgomyces ingoldianus]